VNRNRTAEASRIRDYHLPNWLRLAWLRGARRYGRPPHLGTRGRDVFCEVEGFLDHVAGREGRPALLTYWGSAVIGGRLCLVTGSPANLIDVVDYLTPLAEMVGARMGLVPSWAAGGGIDVVLQPPKGEGP
jgi:hypothetical protein